MMVFLYKFLKKMNVTSSQQHRKQGVKGFQSTPLNTLVGMTGGRLLREGAPTNTALINWPIDRSIIDWFVG